MIEPSEILSSLLPAIEQVDGGCGYCIYKFCDTANERLRQIGSPVIFMIDKEHKVIVSPA